jgi:hypothetical protein
MGPMVTTIRAQMGFCRPFPRSADRLSSGLCSHPLAPCTRDCLTRSYRSNVPCTHARTPLLSSTFRIWQAGVAQALIDGQPMAGFVSTGGTRLYNVLVQDPTKSHPLAITITPNDGGIVTLYVGLTDATSNTAGMPFAPLIFFVLFCFGCLFIYLYLQFSNHFSATIFVECE